MSIYCYSQVSSAVKQMWRSKNIQYRRGRPEHSQHNSNSSQMASATNNTFTTSNTKFSAETACWKRQTITSMLCINFITPHHTHTTRIASTFVMSAFCTCTTLMHFSSSFVVVVACKPFYFIPSSQNSCILFFPSLVAVWMLALGWFSPFTSDRRKTVLVARYDENHE